MIFERNITKKLEKSLERAPVTLLTGARQTGKTTLIKQMGKQRGYSYVTFDDIRFMSAAKTDPLGFIQGLRKPVILDEVQRVPEIFLAIKQTVDERRIPGHFALTGSANPLLIPRLGDSLAGRMEILNLLPLSQGELIGKREHFVSWAFHPQHTPLQPQPPFTKDELYRKIINGGYPLVQGVGPEERHAWFNAYITTILQRDVQDIAHITGLTELPHLLNLLATRAGTLLNMAELSRSSGIANSTLHRYLALLETVFFVYLQQPWHANLSKRLIKAPKTYLIDTGLLSYLLNIEIEKSLSNYKLMGPLLENFVFAELTKQITWSSERIMLYHFRTISGIEIDIILEDGSGNLVGIEVKNSDTVTAPDFKGLRYLQDEVGKKFIKGIVLYTGSEIISANPSLHALPITALWNIDKKSDQ